MLKIHNRNRHIGCQLLDVNKEIVHIINQYHHRISLLKVKMASYKPSFVIGVLKLFKIFQYIYTYNAIISAKNKKHFIIIFNIFYKC